MNAKDTNQLDLSFNLSAKGWKFNSLETEFLFLRWHLSEMLPYAKLAAISGIGTWIAALLLINFIFEKKDLPQIIPYAILSIMFFSFALLISAAKDNLHHLISPIAAVIINSEMFFGVWLLETFLNLQNTANQIVILLSFYAFGLSRLSPKTILFSVLPGITYTLYSHITKFLESEINIVTFSANAFMLYASLFIGIIFMVKLEKLLRQEFTNEKTIEIREQQLIEEKANLSRFLSPEVRQLIKEQGIEKTLSVKTIDLSAVYCDLRGFTHYTEIHGAEKMASLLHDYYQMVVNLSKKYGATVKDFAGDGILILIGAPIERKHHKRDAVRLASEILIEVNKLTIQNTSPQAPLGIGVGVASGRCSVGAIGSDDRLEYTAVGSAVNLSARLCSHANNCEMVVSEDTIKNLPEYKSSIITQLRLSGFKEPTNAVIKLV